MMKSITLKCGAGSVTIPADYDPDSYCSYDEVPFASDYEELDDTWQDDRPKVL